jgi:hypothetical protein
MDDGKLDTDFDGGVVLKNFKNSLNTIGVYLSLDSKDRIITTGYTGKNPDYSMFVTRYLPDGTLDPSFSGGDTTKELIPRKITDGSVVVIDSDDKVVVTGGISDISNQKSFVKGSIVDKAVPVNNSSMFLARYLGDTTTTTLPTTTTTERICLVAGTPILTDQGIVAIEKIDPMVHTINHKRIVAVTKTISPEKHLVCFEANSMAINCPTQRTLMTPGHEVLYKGKLVQAKHFVGRLEGVHTIPYNGKDILYNVLQEQHGLMRVNNMVLETLHPENKVAKELLKK